MIWGRREFLAQFKPQGLGWDLSTVLCTGLSTKKGAIQQWWLVIQCALGCERWVNSSSALPSACILSRRASGWPGGRKLLLGRSSSRTRLMVLGWLLSQVIFLVRKSWAKHFADRLWFSAKSLLLMPLWMNSGTQAFKLRSFSLQLKLAQESRGLYRKVTTVCPHLRERCWTAWACSLRLKQLWTVSLEKLLSSSHREIKA